MGADLYSAGLLVQHELSGSVPVPHRDRAVKRIRECPPETGDPKDQPPHSESEVKEIEGSSHDLNPHSEISIKLAREIGTDYNFKREIVWFNAIGFLILHICGCYGIYLMFSGQAKIWTTIYSEWTGINVPQDPVLKSLYSIHQHSGSSMPRAKASPWGLIASLRTGPSRRTSGFGSSCSICTHWPARTVSGCGSVTTDNTTSTRTRTLTRTMPTGASSSPTLAG